MSDIVTRLRDERATGQYYMRIEAADEIERLRAPFRHATDDDWDYLQRLLVNAIRHPQDQQTLFWLEVVKMARHTLEQQEEKS